MRRPQKFRQKTFGITSFLELRVIYRKISYNCYFNGENKSIDAPIVVDGNKVTIKMSENNSVYRDIEVYMFQDQDNTQMHMYMPATSFEKFFGNVSAAALAKEGKLDLSDAEAVAQIYASIEGAIETINLSFIFKDATRALQEIVRQITISA